MPTHDRKTITGWQVPAPDERWRLLFERLRSSKPISDREYSQIAKMGIANLRAPLTGVTGYLAMLSAGDFGELSPEHRKVIDSLLEETQRLAVIVKDLTELGKLKKGSPVAQHLQGGKKVKIIQFEDDALLRGMYQTKFKMEGFGFAGYESPTKDPVSVVVNEKPDLILMDGIMPLLDGLAATRLLKADARTQNIPILGLDNIGGKFGDDARKAGMVDYLVKAHLTPTDVVNRVRQVLGLPIPPEKPIPPAREAWHGQSVQEMIERAPKQPNWWQRLFKHLP